MRRQCQYIIYLLMACLFMSCSQQKKTDWRVTFDKNSKEPYGCYIAYHLLPGLFPGNKIVSGRNPFTEINRALNSRFANQNKNHFSIVVCRNFETDSLELDKIIRYVQQGNMLCILAENYSENMFRYFHLQPDRVYPTDSRYDMEGSEIIRNQANTLFFNHREYTFHYDGLPIEYAFRIDSTYTGTYRYLGYPKSVDTPNCMVRFEGDGSLMICRNPITLTNHFLLQHDNIDYLRYFFSYINGYPTTVTWYNMYERKMKDNDENSFSWLLNFPPLFYTFLLIVVLLIFYTLFEGKRRQRIIGIRAYNINSSLEFIETVGMLYYNKKDNKNLSDKMILHYLETVRSKYGLKTNALDDEFAFLLSQKTNQSADDTKAFIAYIRYIRDSEEVTDIDIRQLYHQLKKFN